MTREILTQIDAFWRTANYVSVALLYLRENALLQRPLRQSDVKPRALGHWGCVPALNFVWANLLAAIRATAADVRLFVGTGHGGAAWVACSFLEETFPVASARESLDSLCASFGRVGGTPTELAAAYPSVFWASGELGHALGIAHGHGISVPAARVVAVLGDGELETAPTRAALHALRSSPAEEAAVSIIVNLNGFRMGDRSDLSIWSDADIRTYFGFYGFDVTIIDGFNVKSTISTLVRAIGAPQGTRRSAIILRTHKGATVPSLPSGRSLAGAVGSHKAPLKRIESAAELQWLETWLRSYGEIPRAIDGHFDRSAFARMMPTLDLRIGSAAQRSALRRARAPAERCISVASSPSDVASSLSATEAFVAAVRACAANEKQPVLVTSPDELASNRLEGFRDGNIEIRECLSEHQCIAWSIGAITAGRSSWFTTYEAFGTIVTSAIVQYLKYLDAHHAAKTHPLHRPLNIFMTSLAWRNVYSHQDPGLASSLLERRAFRLRCYLPPSAASMEAAVRHAMQSQDTVNCIIGDKYPAPRNIALPPMPESFVSIRTNGRGTPTLTFIVAGGYLVREAMEAASALAQLQPHLAPRVIVLNELTWLYRPSSDCEAERASLRSEVGSCEWLVLLTSLYPDVLASQLREVLPHAHITARGFKSPETGVTAVEALMAARQTWIQLVLDCLQAESARSMPSVKSALLRLDHLEAQLRTDVESAYDDPEWFWAHGADELLGLNRQEIAQ